MKTSYWPEEWRGFRQLSPVLLGIASFRFVEESIAAGHKLDKRLDYLREFKKWMREKHKLKFVLPCMERRPGKGMSNVFYVKEDEHFLAFVIEMEKHRANAY